MVMPTMIDSLLQPLSIFVLALGAGFLIPLFDRAHRGSAIMVFLLALSAMVIIAGFNLLSAGDPHFADERIAVGADDT